ncbi:lysozyme, partial [Streptomyces puniciscabiei]
MSFDDPGEMQALKNYLALMETFINKGPDLTIYLDIYGHPTVGYGHNIDAPGGRDVLHQLGYDDSQLVPGSTITREVAEKLFDADIASTVNQVKHYIPEFDDLPLSVRISLTDVAYNDGAARFFRSCPQEFFDALNDGDYGDAAQQFTTCAKYGRIRADRAGLDMVGILNGDPDATEELVKDLGNAIKDALDGPLNDPDLQQLINPGQALWSAPDQVLDPPPADATGPSLIDTGFQYFLNDVQPPGDPGFLPGTTPGAAPINTQPVNAPLGDGSDTSDSADDGSAYAGTGYEGGYGGQGIGEGYGQASEGPGGYGGVGGYGEAQPSSGPSGPAGTTDYTGGEPGGPGPGEPGGPGPGEPGGP